MIEAYYFMALALGPGALGQNLRRGREAEAAEVVAFWREAGPQLWFAQDPQFDSRFRERFLALHERAAHGRYEHWLASAEGAFALMILLDQFPRNAFRGTPRMYATDTLAREMARRALGAEYDRDWPLQERKFFYLPFAHSEAIADQQKSVALCKRVGERDAASAQRHHDIVARFGRFPHRNKILGRTMTAAEQDYLDGGGYGG